MEVLRNDPPRFACAVDCIAGKPAESTSARLKRLKDLKALKRRKAWEAHVDEASGQPYWFNKETGESSWEDPTK